MGRLHRHADGSLHEHDDHVDDHRHDDALPPSHRDVGDHSGYADSGTSRIAVLERILDENDRVAAVNRERLRLHGVRTVNLMSAPGAGKTTLLQRTLSTLSERLRVGVLEGDIATSLDADQLDGLGAIVSLVNTSAGFGGECHLDAVMVRSGLGRLPLADLDSDRIGALHRSIGDRHRRTANKVIVLLAAICRASGRRADNPAAEFLRHGTRLSGSGV